MSEPTVKLIAINQLRLVADLADACDRETAAEIYRLAVKLAQKIAQKHRFERKAEGVK
jgi:hypothetical protein